jgi:hypothetical protein
MSIEPPSATRRVVEILQSVFTQGRATPPGEFLPGAPLTLLIGREIHLSQSVEEDEPGKFYG